MSAEAMTVNIRPTSLREAEPQDTILERISLGEVAPHEAIVAIRELLRVQSDSFALRAYNILKMLTLKMLSARRTGELAEWTDVIRQTSALAKGRGEEGLGERLLTLSDLTTDWMRIVEAHPIKVVLERPHVRNILETIRNLGGRVERSRVMSLTKIGDANLSRILGSLESIGLIERDNRRQRTITLTAEGERLLGRTHAHESRQERDYYAAVGTEVLAADYEQGAELRPTYKSSFGPSEIRKSLLSHVAVLPTEEEVNDVSRKGRRRARSQARRAK
jgi:DNA-binding MarR family transcriptional regulator